MRKLVVLLMALCLACVLPSNAYAGPRTGFNADIESTVFSGFNAMNATVFEDPQLMPEVNHFVWLPEMVADEPISKREEGLDMKGVLPELTEAYIGERDSLNDQINGLVADKITAAKESKARTITFEYTVYDTDTLVSVIILSTVTSATQKTEVMSFNFNPLTGQRVGLTEAIGINIGPLAEKLLTEKIRRDPERYNAAFDKLLKEQAFYITEDMIVLLFDEFQLLPGSEGIAKLELYLNKIADITVTRAEYYIAPGGFNLKMVPLRLVCTGLGYEVYWAPTHQSVEIYHNGALMMELVPGQNNYLVKDKKVRSLEAAPEMLNDTVYVPISFFDQILALVTYSVDSKDNITFLSYMEAE